MFDQAVYVVLVREGGEVYADMALVSILSLKLTNPTLPVCLLCDRESARLLRSWGHRLPGVCDSVQELDTPDGPVTYRHRWIKTQLPAFIRGPGLHLDADTLVRGSLATLPHGDWEFAAAHDYNRPDMSDHLQTLPHVIKARELGWPLDLKPYFNGGVFCWQDTAPVHAFFAEWHRLWYEGAVAGELLMDQPSFNATLQRGLMTFSTLPNAFNTMVLPAWDLAPEAVVWHFWSGGGWMDHSFGRLVQQAKHLSTWRLRAHIQRAIRFSRPWPNTGGGLARLLDWRGHRHGGYRTLERLWLSRQRRLTLRHLLDLTRRPLARDRQEPPDPGERQSPLPR